jgi:hypothetical protein
MSHGLINARAVKPISALFTISHSTGTISRATPNTTFSVAAMETGSTNAAANYTISNGRVYLNEGFYYAELYIGTATSSIAASQFQIWLRKNGTTQLGEKGWVGNYMGDASSIYYISGCSSQGLQVSFYAKDGDYIDIAWAWPNSYNGSLTYDAGASTRSRLFLQKWK